MKLQRLPRTLKNYKSAEEHSASIRKTHIEEERGGVIVGPLTAQQAADICGCSTDELCCGALAGKPDGRCLDKPSTIHDATVNNIDKWIRLHMTEKTTAPGLHDLPSSTTQAVETSHC